MYFLSKRNFCDFVTFFTKKSSTQKWSILPKWRTQKFVILLQFFINWTKKRVKVNANNWSAKNRDQLIRNVWKCSKEFDMAPRCLTIWRAKLWRLTNSDWEVLPRNNQALYFFWPIWIKCYDLSKLYWWKQELRHLVYFFSWHPLVFRLIT